MGFQPQLFSDERLDEQLDPLPFVVVNNNPRKVRRIRVSCQSLSRHPAVSKSLQLQLHFSDTNPRLKAGPSIRFGSLDRSTPRDGGTAPSKGTSPRSSEGVSIR